MGNARKRANLKDFTGYIQTLQTQAEQDANIKNERADEYLVRNIIGYNSTTNEILISGPQTSIDEQQRWVYLHTAQLSNQGTIEYIDWLN